MRGSSPLDQLSDSPSDRFSCSVPAANQLPADVLPAARQLLDRALDVLAAPGELLPRPAPSLDHLVDELGRALTRRARRPGRRLECLGDGDAQRLRQGLWL